MEQTEIKQKISTTKNNTNETSERQKKRSFFGDNLCYFFHAVTEVAMILMQSLGTSSSMKHYSNPCIQPLHFT